MVRPEFSWQVMDAESEIHKEECAAQILDARIHSSVSDRKNALVTGMWDGTDRKFRGLGFRGFRTLFLADFLARVRWRKLSQRARIYHWF
jgi:hypothetical protein